MLKSKILDEVYDIKCTLDIWLNLGGDVSHNDITTIRDRLSRILGDHLR